jgi:hypothetical protein
MNVTQLCCRQCGSLHDLVSVMDIDADRILISRVPAKQRHIVDAKRAASCRRHGAVWCWACWSAQYAGPIPDRIDVETGRRVGRGESRVGGHA